MYSGLYGQGVRFSHDLSIEKVIELAKNQGKGIFIDTYADWCIPCKKMEIEFRNRELARFLNKNFICVRIDMDRSRYAQEYRSKFNIVFLPTMVVMDHHGNVKYKTDKIIPGRELLSIARGSHEQGIYYANEAAAVESNPFSSKVVNEEEQVATQNKPAPPNKTTKTIPSKKPQSSNPTTQKKTAPQPNSGRVVYSMGSGTANPDFLRREAYFRIELMDGSHRVTADKYLATQDDFSSDTNVRFIYDFLYSVHAPTFHYMIDNRARFEEVVGKDQIRQTIALMVDNELSFGYPRPNFEQTQKLFKLVDSVDYQTKSYQYFLSRLLEECDYSGYKKMGLEYLNEVQQPDHQVFYNIAELCFLNEDDKSELKQCREWLKTAVKNDSENVFYQDLMTQLLIKLKDKRKAKKAAKRLVMLAKQYNFELDYYYDLQRKVENL